MVMKCLQNSTEFTKANYFTLDSFFSVGLTLWGYIWVGLANVRNYVVDQEGVRHYSLLHENMSVVIVMSRYACICIISVLITNVNTNI